MGYIYERGFANFGALICILVIIPVLSPAQQVYDIISKHQEVSLFVEVIDKAELAQQLNSNGPYTIFAPTNNALANLEDQIKRADKSWARNFVMNHVLTGMATKRQIVAMSKAPTMGGLVLTITQDQQSNIMLNEVTGGVRIVKPNIRANNGIIHFIDGRLEQD